MTALMNRRVLNAMIDTAAELGYLDIVLTLMVISKMIVQVVIRIVIRTVIRVVIMLMMMMKVMLMMMVVTMMIPMLTNGGTRRGRDMFSRPLQVHQQLMKR